ncbi:LOW QUALITY PROTEIN: putative membrane protein, partial [Streptomyces himastatinicus ATCC 53653]
GRENAEGRRDRLGVAGPQHARLRRGEDHRSAPPLPHPDGHHGRAGRRVHAGARAQPPAARPTQRLRVPAHLAAGAERDLQREPGGRVRRAVPLHPAGALRRHAVAAQPLVGRQPDVRPAPHPDVLRGARDGGRRAGHLTGHGPGPEYYGGRLVRRRWCRSPPPQIGQYAAVIIGLTVLLVLGRRTTRGSAAFVIVPSLVLLALTHTRTATVGLLIGLVLAIGSLVLTSAAARRFFAWAVLVAAVAAVVFASALQAWFLRGQSKENFSNLTGRAKVWDALLAAPRTAAEQAFGVGLGDKSFGGLPIDNSWLAVYNEQGLIGVTLVAAIIIVLAGVALLRPPSLPRACAIFLISYVAISSYTEAGLGDASPYLLHLALAASLLAAPATATPRATATPFMTPAVPQRRIPRWARR